MAILYGCKSRDLKQISEFFDRKITEFNIETQYNHINLINSIRKRISEIELLDYHHSIAQRQRKSYVDMKENLPEGSLLIEIDFKQKIKIGLSPKQINSEFYRQKSRYFLSFGIYFRKQNKVECLNVDIISDNLKQTGFSVISAFRSDFFLF
jgi:hypothetical protein